MAQFIFNITDSCKKNHFKNPLLSLRDAGLEMLLILNKNRSDSLPGAGDGEAGIQLNMK